MKVIDCKGNGRARGQAHGEEARDLIGYALDNWRVATLSEQAGKTEVLEYVRKFLGSTGLISAMERTTPDLLEEIRGIAEGAAVPYELIAAYNLMDEQWWYDLDSEAAEPGCSLLGVSDGNVTRLSQNMDLPAFMDGSQIALRLSPVDGPKMLVLSSAGLIGLTGINSDGIAICVNALLMLSSNPNGVPVSAALRHALEQSSVVNARAVLEGMQHASGQHYAIADRSGMVGLECSADGCVESSPWGEQILIHTNHPLASGDLDPHSLAILEARGRVSHSKERLTFLKHWIGSTQMPADADIIQLLSDASTPICATATAASPGQTFGSVTFSLDEAPTAFFCLGRPGAARWQTIPFE